MVALDRAPDTSPKKRTLAQQEGEVMRIRKMMTIAAAASMLVAPVTIAAQTAPVQPAYSEHRDNPAISVIGVILATLVIAIAIKAIGRDRPLPEPTPVSP